jgi:dipeptidyl aminopeptidase/acylaminoacyl peptidase
MTTNRNPLSILTVITFVIFFPALVLAQKPPLTFDEFFNSVDIQSVKLSPDGSAVVIATERADWKNNRWSDDLWLYRLAGAESGTLIQLTQSGHDTKPEWSPDGRWIAFLSDRESPKTEGDDETGSKKPENVKQVYVIASSGGEAFPVTFGEEEVHAFDWSRDSRQIFYATRIPWTKEQQETYKKEWKDVVQYRESERGDAVRSLDITRLMDPKAVASGTETPAKPALATLPYRVDVLRTSPDGQRLALETIPISERQDSMEAYNIYLVDLPGGKLSLLSHTEAVYERLSWAPDSRHLFFLVQIGTVEGPYRDLQPRVYSIDAQTGAIERWGSHFDGAITGYAVLPDASLFAAGRLGTEVAAYTERNVGAEFSQQKGWPGTYEHLATAEHSDRVAFVYSTLQKPVEVYVADSPAKLVEARAITSFNRLFTERALPQGKPYRWTVDDGTQVEGMLVYPPGKFEAKNLPMFTFIHGGPADADGNHFEADWYQWAALAATQGWLVFEPNYRGSVGYGDNFTLGIIPRLVSRPGKDILEGVDALVKDGIADPARLTIGGYSYGGYMTNWLITQTTRFKAAVTGAGAVEHVANWGNDDVSFDDTYFLGGLPWNAEKNINDEAAIWQMNKVRTPTHIVGGGDDIRVYVGEDYLLERALHALGIPSTLLIFPGEGHSLGKNPWHGKIKVREELKWLEKYGGK